MHRRDMTDHVDARESGSPCYAVIMLTKANPDEACQRLASLASDSRRPCHIVVVDGASEPDDRVVVIDGDDRSVHHWWVGDDLGTAGSLDVGLRYVQDCDAVLVMDDEGIPFQVPIATLLAQLDTGCDVVAARPSSEDRRVRRAVGSDLLHWPPTLMRMSAIRCVGAPRAELFYAVDRWELLTRLRRHGFTRRDIVSSTGDPMPGPGRYPGHEHDLIVRNLTYLAFYAAGLRRAAVARLLRYLRTRGRASTVGPRPGGTVAAVRRGAARRLGPPEALRRLPS